MNQLSLQNIKVNYANKEVTISDYFVDQYSLQEQLKEDYLEAFEKGRFKEFFLPVLGQRFIEKLDVQDERISSRVPENQETLITPIYGCHDDCCVYIFAEVSRKDDLVYWNAIGRNKTFLKKDNLNTNIDWLPDFSPFCFSISNYNKIMNQLNK